MGRAVAVDVAQRFGRSILELGGNNAIGDAQRRPGAGRAPSPSPPWARRPALHHAAPPHRAPPDVAAPLLHGWKIYASVRAGDPLEDGCRRPAGDRASFEADAERPGKRVNRAAPCRAASANARPGRDAWYARPALVRMPAQSAVVQHETFAPILYVLGCASLEEAIALQNGVPQGLSSAIFTTDLREAERFVSSTGSDCGIANVNIGTSGAEIGAPFGGERKPAVAANRPPTPGRATCAAPPTPSTTATLFPRARRARRLGMKYIP